MTLVDDPLPTRSRSAHERLADPHPANVVWAELVRPRRVTKNFERIVQFLIAPALMDPAFSFMDAKMLVRQSRYSPAEVSQWTLILRRAHYLMQYRVSALTARKLKKGQRDDGARAWRQYQTVEHLCLAAMLRPQDLRIVGSGSPFRMDGDPDAPYDPPLPNEDSVDA